MKDSTTTHTLYNVYRYVPYENGFVSILPVEFVFDKELTKVLEARPFNEDFFRMVINQLHRQKQITAAI